MTIYQGTGKRRLPTETLKDHARKMIKMIFSVAFLALMPGSAAAEDWRDEPTRLAAAKTINELATHCDELGFDRSQTLDDSAVSAMISVYLQGVPDSDLVFASWTRARDRLLSSKADSEAYVTARQFGDPLTAAISDPTPESRARAEELWVQAFLPLVAYGLEQCRLGAVDPFFSKLWSGKETADLEQTVRLAFRATLQSAEQMREIGRQTKPIAD